ncbi:MAG: HAMP domain-containing histidine kinase [Bacteroidales bacterium]|jgi:signal transduction histidine kinase|nr:HAMP domain-containing histidine kinase [Bacteroidales bacterium]
MTARRKISLIKRLYMLKRRMYVNNISLRLLIILVCLLLFAKLVETGILFPRFDTRHAERIQKIFLHKEQKLNEYVEKTKQNLNVSDSVFFRLYQAIDGEEPDKQGLYIFVYRDDRLMYWSTKDVPVAGRFSESGFDKPYISITNKGRYASYVYPYGDYTIVGLILIKNVYYDNKYLPTAFQKDFGLPDNVKIFPEMQKGYYPIYDGNGRFVWALIFDGTCRYRYQAMVPAIAYFCAILVFFLLVDSLFKRLKEARKKNLYLPFFTVILLLLRYLMQKWHIPPYFYELDMFNPVWYASEWFPSLGDLFLWSLFVCVFIIGLYRHLRIAFSYENRWKYYLWMLILLLTATVFFFSIGPLLKTLVFNSSDMFEGPNHNTFLGRHTLISYLIIMMWVFSFCLLLDKTLLLCRRDTSFRQFLILCAMIASPVIIVCLLAGWYVDGFSVLCFAGMVGIMAGIRLKRSIRYKYSHFVLMIFVASVLVTAYINTFSSLKYNDRKKVIITNLASPHDLIAESLLREVSENIITDTVMTDYMYDRNKEIVDYVKRIYFYSSYWNSYRYYQCVVCSDSDSLELSGGARVPNCVNFFRRMIEQIGTPLSRSQFYFINRQQTDQYPSYLGWFRKEKGDGYPLHLFIEIWMGGDTDGIGYPELLIDQRTVKNNLKGYSWAKYWNNRRISQSGTFNYNLSGDIFKSASGSDYYTIVADGMEHLVYTPDKTSMIVLSSRSTRLTDIIVNFSYIFLFVFLMLSACTLMMSLPSKQTFRWGLQHKIQYSMIVCIVMSFGIIGIYTIFYISRQYRTKYDGLTKEKMQSVHRELSDIIQSRQGRNHQLTENPDELTEILMALRGTFFTDINLFDIHGKLIATSLPDIFDKGLLSRQINPDAFVKLTFGQRASILEREEIGGLKYISAYEPFVTGNNVIAFLNLTYFTQQDEFREEISSLVLAITNFYMIIILLTVIISVVMSNQIIHPLILLQEKFRNIRLGEKNDPIRYSKNDEIGKLVMEYNRAIEELAQSASQLARSERESAWRDMAKQIAHEINNPLTPMKLSIQHLKRAWDNKSERFSDYMEKISHSLVEQIDNLSAIATEFSNFAKMPSVHNRLMDIITSINDVVPLYATGDNKRAFHLDFHGLDSAIIFADKEQISRVFINLFKNAMQAIPKERPAQIQIDVLKLNKVIWIRIKDNGMGIPENMQEKIFRPNFTTKSSGMGVGLAIVRNIIEGSGGTISFRTKQNEGTVFIISLPAMENEAGSTMV